MKLPTPNENDLSSTVNLSEYNNFHGMLCSPRTASRCIQSFDGMILFMPSTYHTAPGTALATFDCSGFVTTFSYYLLVIISFTGLSTLLNMTIVRMAVVVSSDTPGKLNESLTALPNDFTSEYNANLRIEPDVLEYCKQYTGASSITLKRRFEYRFVLCGGLDVMMLHFVCNQNKLHLVEVYHFDNEILQKWFAPLLNFVGQILRNVTVKKHMDQSVKKQD
jgi:hypothetical protein